MAEQAELEWRAVPTHPRYFVNAAGQIRGPRGHVMRPMSGIYGHLYVLVPPPRRPRKLFVHRAVLFAFIGPPPTPAHETRHLDGDPSNNTLANLQWGTHTENMRDKALHGTELHSEAKADARLTTAQARSIRLDSRSSRVVGKEYGVSHTAVLRIRRGDRWKRAA